MGISFSLNLLAMSPEPLHFGSQAPDSPASTDTAPTISCSTENSRCATPDPLGLVLEQDGGPKSTRELVLAHWRGAIFPPYWVLSMIHECTYLATLRFGSCWYS